MKFLIFLVAIGALIGSGCSNSSGSAATTTSTINESKPSTVMSAVSTAVATVGTSMGSQSVSSASVGEANPVKTLDISQDCDTHAQPLRAGVAVAESDPDYPGKFMYCKIAYNTEDPESVQGAFAETKAISCLLEAAGLVFDGASHTYSVTPSQPCFSAHQLASMGGTPTALAITAVASSPAAFNTYYDKGMDLTITGLGEIKVAVNATASKVEFLAVEDFTAAHPGHYDTYASSLNFTTGELRYELRSNRYTDNTESNSGGFARHQRIYASVAVSGQSVTALKSISAAQNEVYNGAIQSGYGGKMVTATGDTTSGIKARFWSATNGSGSNPTATSDLTNPSKWVETTNNRCYTNGSASAGTCSAGIAIPTTASTDSFPFTQQGTGSTAGSDWSAVHGAWTFTSVDPSVDTQ